MKNYLLSVAVFLVALTCSAQTNNALSFNGTNQYVAIGMPLVSSGSYTKEAWVFATTSSGARNIISSLNAPLYLNGTTLTAGQAGTYNYVIDPTAFPVNQWVHVAVTYDAPTTTLKLYRDGNLVSTNAAVPAYTAEATVIGSHQGSTSFFQGNIDEVRLWTIALTQARLKEDMYKGPDHNAVGLVAYYKFNEGSGAVLTNSSTNTTGLDGVIMNVPSWVSSPVQQGLNAIAFDGTNDVVTIPSNSSLNITTAITLEAWVFATKNSGIQNVISKSSSSQNTGYIFPRTDDGWANVVVYLNIAGGWRTLSAPYPGLNAWHHLAATYDGAMMKLYIDGSLAASQARTGTIAVNSNNLALGNQPGFSEFFGGIADEFRLWNVARTATEILDNYKNELNPTTQTGLVSYYMANQGIAAGTNAGMLTLVDQEGTNNGTLSGFALSGSTSNFVSQLNTIFPLPVTWVSFTAQKQSNGVLLQWSTASEQNSKDFTVQHSVDANNWNNLNVLAAAGNSNSARNYNSIDVGPANGINYYRVMETDFDGKRNFSEIRSVKFAKTELLFTLLANPVTTGILRVNISKPISLSLYSDDGRQLLQKNAEVGVLSIDVSHFPKGLYFLKTAGQSEKLLLQ